MKFCNKCGKTTAGEPLYCSTCGCTYEVKLCPRHHPNPRGAEVCSQCGSRELSTPQPSIPIGLRFLALIARLVLGLLLFYATLSVLIALAQSPKVQELAMACGILLGILWMLWSKLPDWSKEALRDFWVTRRHSNDE